jgi:hypothetical protein
MSSNGFDLSNITLILKNLSTISQTLTKLVDAAGHPTFELVPPRTIIVRGSKITATIEAADEPTARVVMDALRLARDLAQWK